MMETIWSWLIGLLVFIATCWILIYAIALSLDWRLERLETRDMPALPPRQTYCAKYPSECEEPWI